MNILPTFKIENIVASLHPTGEVDLKHIATFLKNAEYEPCKFPGAIYRIKEPEIAFLIFDSGKINCSLSKNIEYLETSIDILLDDLYSIGYIITNKDYRIQNVVAIADCPPKEKVDMDEVVDILGADNIEYEPDLFPGIVYRNKEPKCIVLILWNGGMVISGTKSIADYECVRDDVLRKLYN